MVCVNANQSGKQRGQPCDPPSDVYALGVVLYWLLCQRYPFRAADPKDLQREILQDAPQPPRQLAHGVPPELERLCLRLLSKDPAARPANAEEFARELRQVIAQLETVDLNAELSTRVRKVAVTAREVELLLVLTWDASPATPQWQHALRDDIEQRHGSVLSQSECVTVARLSRIDGLTAGMPTFLHHALAIMAELKVADAEVGFSIDSAEAESLRHRAPRLRGRISVRGVEWTPQSLALIRRWQSLKSVPVDEPERASVRFGHEADNKPDASTFRLTIAPVKAIAIELPLVGRASQLAILKARWDQACEGMGQIVLLIGDEGTGKTRLVQELRSSIAAAAQSAEWICWTCRPGSEENRPHPATEYFRRQTRQRLGDGDNAPAIAGEMGDELSEAELSELTAVQNRERWQRALVAWLKRVAAVRPVVFVVEDLQWADPTTLAFLHMLIDLGLHERVLTILTCRPEFETPWGSRAHQTQVALSRLTKRHAASLFSSITGVTEPSASVVDELLAASDGIPLFVEGFAMAWAQTNVVSKH